MVDTKFAVIELVGCRPADIQSLLMLDDTTAMRRNRKNRSSNGSKDPKFPTLTSPSTCHGKVQFSRGARCFSFQSCRRPFIYADTATDGFFHVPTYDSMVETSVEDTILLTTNAENEFLVEKNEDPLVL